MCPWLTGGNWEDMECKLLWNVGCDCKSEVVYRIQFLGLNVDSGEILGKRWIAIGVSLRAGLVGR